MCRSLEEGGRRCKCTPEQRKERRQPVIEARLRKRDQILEEAKLDLERAVVLTTKKLGPKPAGVDIAAKRAPAERTAAPKSPGTRRDYLPPRRYKVSDRGLGFYVMEVSRGVWRFFTLGGNAARPLGKDEVDSLSRYLDSWILSIFGFLGIKF